MKELLKLYAPGLLSELDNYWIMMKSTALGLVFSCFSFLDRKACKKPEVTTGDEPYSEGIGGSSVEFVSVNKLALQDKST